MRSINNYGNQTYQNKYFYLCINLMLSIRNSVLYLTHPLFLIKIDRLAILIFITIMIKFVKYYLNFSRRGFLFKIRIISIIMYQLTILIIIIIIIYLVKYRWLRIFIIFRDVTIKNIFFFKFVFLLFLKFFP